jgi:hypothetical protein
VFQKVPSLPSRRSACVSAAAGEAFLIAVCTGPEGRHFFELKQRRSHPWHVRQHQRGVLQGKQNEAGVLDFLYSSPAAGQPDPSFGPHFITAPNGTGSHVVCWRSDVPDGEIQGFQSSDLRSWDWMEGTGVDDTYNRYVVPGGPRHFFRFTP